MATAEITALIPVNPAAQTLVLMQQFEDIRFYSRQPQPAPLTPSTGGTSKPSASSVACMRCPPAG